MGFVKDQSAKILRSQHQTTAKSCRNCMEFWDFFMVFRGHWGTAPAALSIFFSRKDSTWAAKRQVVHCHVYSRLKLMAKFHTNSDICTGVKLSVDSLHHCWAWFPLCIVCEIHLFCVSYVFFRVVHPPFQFLLATSFGWPSPF